MAVGFIFGGDNMPKTPQELARMRAMAEALSPRRSPQNVGEGIASIGNALLYRALMGRADRAETAGIDGANNAFSSLFDTPATPDTPDAVPDPVTTAPESVIRSPQDAVDAAPAQPLTGDLAQMEAYIRQAATKRGIDPDTAVRVARSEGLAPGIWQSNVMKKGARETSYGPFQMLVGDGKTFPKGMGNDFITKTGLDPKDPKNANAMIDFALDQAKLGGWSPWYGAKKVGVNRWDGINADQVASLDPSIAPQKRESVPVVPVPEGFQQADPLALDQPAEVADASSRIPQKVADALTTRRRIDPMKAYEVLNNPYLPDGRRAALNALLKQQFDNENMEREQQLRQADPKYQLELEKGRIEVDNLKNPKQARPLTQAEEEAMGLPVDGVYQRLPDGSVKTIREPANPLDDVNRRKAEAELKALESPPQTVTLTPDEAQALGLDPTGAYQRSPDGKISMVKEPSALKPTATMQEYDAYRDDEVKAGRQPLSRLEYEQALRSASASRNEVNIDQKTEGAFDKKLAEKQAETFNTMADEGINARADIDIINQLEAFMKDKGGTLSGMSALASGWGIPVEGADDLQAATALINKLVPTQRQPGSGTMSDRDVELFKSSLPSLWNQPGGNEKILGVMRGLAEYKQRQGEIADMVIMNEMTRQEARRALREIPNPLEAFRKSQKAKKTEIDGYTVEEVE